MRPISIVKPLGIFGAALFFCLLCTNVDAKDVLVKSRFGSTPYKKLVSAVNFAQPGDVVIVDIDVPFKSTDGGIVLTKGITIKGAPKPTGRFKLTRQNSKGNRFSNSSTLLVVRSSNVRVENLELVVNNQQGYKAIDVGSPANRSTVYSNLRFINCIFNQANANDIARGLFFEGSFNNVLINKCKFNFWFSLVVRDCPTLTNFKITRCEFSRGSHQISLDGALLGEVGGVGALVSHKNIVIERSKFKVTKSFNIAIANTRNVIVRNNSQLDGGTASYSQPVHIEDRSRNIFVSGNTMKSIHMGVLVYSSDRFGHGQGRTFSLTEKSNRGSGNVTVSDNQITVTGTAPAIGVTYLNGALSLRGNNVIKANGKALSVARTKSGNITIEDQTSMKGKLYSAIKNLPTSQRNKYYTSDRLPR